MVGEENELILLGIVRAGFAAVFLPATFVLVVIGCSAERIEASIETKDCIYFLFSCVRVVAHKGSPIIAKNNKQQFIAT